MYSNLDQKTIDLVGGDANHLLFVINRNHHKNHHLIVKYYFVSSGFICDKDEKKQTVTNFALLLVIRCVNT
jgi:hypothetical protein